MVIFSYFDDNLQAIIKRHKSCYVFVKQNIFEVVVFYFLHFVVTTYTCWRYLKWMFTFDVLKNVCKIFSKSCWKLIIIISYLFFITACEHFSPKSFRFHPGIWLSKRWSCCKSLSRTALGCQVTTQWPETNNNPTSKSIPPQSYLFVFL